MRSANSMSRPEHRADIQDGFDLVERIRGDRDEVRVVTGRDPAFADAQQRRTLAIACWLEVARRRALAGAPPLHEPTDNRLLPVLLADESTVPAEVRNLRSLRSAQAHDREIVATSVGSKLSETPGRIVDQCSEFTLGAEEIIEEFRGQSPMPNANADLSGKTALPSIDLLVGDVNRVLGGVRIDS